MLISFEERGYGWDMAGFMVASTYGASDDVVNRVQLAGPEIAEVAKPDIFGI
jgi:hypothetical protein